MHCLVPASIAVVLILAQSHLSVSGSNNKPLHCFLCRFLPCTKHKLAVCVRDGCKCMKLVDIYNGNIELGYPYPGFIGPRGRPPTAATPTPKPCEVAVSGPGSVDVPCGFTLDLVDGANLTLTNGCSGSDSRLGNYVGTELVYTSNGDSTHLIAVDPATGRIYRSPSAVPQENVTHVYQFRLTALPNLQNSTAVNVTFHFGSCVLGLDGPSSAKVCPGYPPGFDPDGKPYNAYSQLTFVATNVAPLMPIIFDLASDATPNPGLGATSIENMNIYSPAVLPGSDDPQVFISNLNSPTLANQPSTSPIGIYGAGNNGDLPCGGVATTVNTDPTTGAVTGSCCQNLLFSVSPGVAVTPYLTGQKQVKVCYEDANAPCTIV